MNSITNLFLYLTIAAVLLRSSESCKPCDENLNSSCCNQLVTTIFGSFCEAIIEEDTAKGVITINAGETVPAGTFSSSSALISQINTNINALTGFGSNSIYMECLMNGSVGPEPTSEDILTVERQGFTAGEDEEEVAEATALSENTPTPPGGCPTWSRTPPPLGIFMGTTKCEFLQFLCVEYVKDYNRCLREYLANIQLVYITCAGGLIEAPGFNPCARSTRKCIKAGLLQALQSFENCRLGLNREVPFPCFPGAASGTCTWPSTLQIV